MFDIGLSEIIVIMIIALLVIGPKKLPDVARAMGKGLAEFRRALDNVKDELNVDQIKSDANAFKDSLLFGSADKESQEKAPEASRPGDIPPEGPSPASSPELPKASGEVEEKNG